MERMLGTTEFECTEMGFRPQYLKAVEELLDLGPVAWAAAFVVLLKEQNCSHEKSCDFM